VQRLLERIEDEACVRRARDTPAHNAARIDVDDERRTVKLDLEAYPHLPHAEVKATRAADYLALTAARNIEMAA
jgi:hypothetical protein